MNEHDPMNIAEIEDLALHHTFDELSPAQQSMALSALGSADAYAQLRNVLLAARETFAASELTPDPSIHIELRKRLAERRSPVLRVGMLTRLLSYRLATYQTAMAMAAVAAITFFLRPAAKEPPPIVQERTVYVPLHDTVMQPSDRAAIIREVTDSLRAELARQIGPSVRAMNHLALKRQPSTEPRKPEDPSSSDPNESAPRTFNSFVGLANLPQLSQQKRGRTVAEDSALSRFTKTMSWQ